MLVSVFLVLFLPCVGMSVVFLVYICLLWYAAADSRPNPPAKPAANHGLSPAELEKLAKTTGKGLPMGAECAVCLDDIGEDDPARIIPGCNHGFHLQCADTWLTKNPVCPVCRGKLEPEFFNPPESNPC